MTLALFSQDLSSFPAARARLLDEQIGLEAVYALVWPDYAPPIDPIPERNRLAFARWRQESGVPLWAWLNCSSDQKSDARVIKRLDVELEPDGWLLDIEGAWTQGAKLPTVLEAAALTGRPCRASLAGASPSLVEYDWRELERQGFDVDWQAYFDSGEGPFPSTAVAELYQSSFVIAGWTYRHRVGKNYGFGRVSRIEAAEIATFDSFMRPGGADALFGVLPREFGWTVDDRILWPANPDKPPIGLLMGRAAYPKIRVTLDTTRTASVRPPAAWTPIAASARIPNARKRGVSVYLAETTSDEVLAAIAAGAS